MLVAIYRLALNPEDAKAGSYNTWYGDGAMQNGGANISGSDNTAFGFNALGDYADSIMMGYNNTAVGSAALYFDQAGFYNTAVGCQALLYNGQGSANTAIGGGSLLNSQGSSNTSVGFYSLYFNTGGSYNTATGTQALFQNTVGSGNTAGGAFALLNNTTAGSNTAYGYFSLCSNTSGFYNTANGVYALFGNTLGSASVAIGAYALCNNTTGDGNTAEGFEALYLNTVGLYNTANGAAAMYGNISGNYNTANGTFSLVNNALGSMNAANGALSLYANVSGSYNTAEGAQALYENKDGDYNTACGFSALYSNQSGLYNTASGCDALFSDSSGSYNTASGSFALCSNTIGSRNTAIGYLSLASYSGQPLSVTLARRSANESEISINPPNGGNTACGYGALSRNTNGNLNIALGAEAGINVLSGSDNVDIGNPGATEDDHIIRIGSGQLQAFVAGIWGAGIGSGTPVYVNSAGQLGTIPSSARFKEKIQDMGDESAALLSLRPVTFQYRKALDASGAEQFGLIAEEVSAVDPRLVVRDASNQIYSVRYEAVNAMLLNEFLKQHKTMEKQSAEIRKQQQEIAALLEKASEIDDLEERLMQLEKLCQTSAR
jgi:hypothetical protein